METLFTLARLLQLRMVSVAFQDGPAEKVPGDFVRFPTHSLLEVTFMVVGDSHYWILCPTEERARGRYCGDFRCYWVILC